MEAIKQKGREFIEERKQNGWGFNNERRTSPKSPNNQEIKTALQLSFVDREEISGTTYYYI